MDVAQVTQVVSAAAVQKELDILGKLPSHDNILGSIHDETVKTPSHHSVIQLTLSRNRVMVILNVSKKERRVYGKEGRISL